MKTLYLEDLADCTEEQIKEHFLGEYQADASEVKKYRVLIAWESVGDWGCDSSSWFLLKDKKTGKLYEVNGSHCSCYGFEGQFEPEETSIDYIKSEHFSFYRSGRELILEYVNKMR